MKKLLLISIVVSMIVGCTSNKISLNTAKPYEKRYTTNDVIEINNSRIVIDKDESVWILTNSTLNNLLQYANGNNIEEIE